MSPFVHLLTVTFLWSFHSASVAQSTDYSTLTMFFAINSTVRSTLRASTESSDNESTAPDPAETDPTNATVPLNGSSTAQSETSPEGGGYGTPSVGPAGASENGTENTAGPLSPTAEQRPTASPQGPEETQSSPSPSRRPGVPSPTLTETPASTTRASCEVPTLPGEKDPKTEKSQYTKTLGVFVGLAVVLLLVFGLVYLIYNRTQKDDPFSHQRLYNSDPVLSLDVSVEPADRFYGSLTPDLGREGQGDHVTSQRALNQSACEAKGPNSPPQTRDEIQLKPMSESSVKIFL
ncbi:proline-rich receptor-like protein kinase PERK1 [Scyliorhinus canicula]|uniref:proline-rich receptor-like protein kinase PERK1 n=1 Tax=Scyliorhinus canicula TaxID=7830 RepID=UPI0018F7709D|nr:proline-rich receptor-like protein kinase PERK1 [Scyliorhinus canicula]XP_038639606.1 proline-rich receptor-like protein kinase PERK1 [Scyliorhinus canicula]